MKFCHSTLNVKNLEESIGFYEEIVGLGVVRRFSAGNGMEIAFLGEGETKVELIYDKNHTEIDAGKDISWGFETDSIEETMKIVREKGMEIIGPFSPAPAVKFFFVKDPNGLKIQFIEHIK
ncbi:MAG TPA: VOC family protein [Clostridia bacterium]|jgi:lactoylglutathione lyase|nr:VOC family protein [Clostridia bacterium]